MIFVGVGLSGLMHLEIALLALVICNLVAMCCSGIINFAINNLVIFKKKKAV